MGTGNRPQEARHIGRWTRRLYGSLGMVMLVLAGIGVVLPVMPTTIFVILAAACFSRASPRWEAYLLQHPRFGPPLVAWREQGAISVRGKAFAMAGIAAGLAIFWVCTDLPRWLGVLVTAFMVGCALWILRRPTPRAP